MNSLAFIGFRQLSTGKKTASFNFQPITINHQPVTINQLPYTSNQQPTFPLVISLKKNDLKNAAGAKIQKIAACFSGGGLDVRSYSGLTAGVGAHPLPGPTLAFQFMLRFLCITVYLSRFESGEKWPNMAESDPKHPAPKPGKCMHIYAYVYILSFYYATISYGDINGE